MPCLEDCSPGLFSDEVCTLIWKGQGLIAVSGLLGYGHTFLRIQSLVIFCNGSHWLGSSLAAATAPGFGGQALTLWKM